MKRFLVLTLRRDDGSRSVSESGGALVELAIALPMLVVVLIGTIDFARVFSASIALTNAARAGAQYGASNPANSGNTGTMESTATAATSLTGVTAAASRLCQCANDSGTFSPTATANDCSSPETTSCPGKHLVITVTVTTAANFSTIMSGFSGFPRALSLSRYATLRVIH